MTEFIGVSLALGYFGVSAYISVPLAAAVLIAVAGTGQFRRWEQFMYLFIAVNFVAIPLAILSHPHLGQIAAQTFVPGVQGGFSSTSILLIVSIVGTTVAPWQLFFQQSNVIDKRITPRWMNYERADTILLPSATVFLILLCNDRDVLGPHTNPRWLNAIAGLIVGVLVVLSAILTVTTLFKHADVNQLAEILFGALALGLLTAAVYTGRDRRHRATPEVARETLSKVRLAGLYTLRGYLVAAVIMLIVKAIEVSS